MVIVFAKKMRPIARSLTPATFLAYTGRSALSKAYTRLVPRCQ